MKEMYGKVSGTFLLRAIGIGLAFLLQILFGRFLGPNLYGEYSIYITYVNIFSLISLLGMDKNLIKEVAKLTNNVFKARNLLNYSIYISLIIYIFIIVVIVIFHGTLFSFISADMIYLFFVMLLIKVLIELLDGFLQGSGMIIRVTFFNALLNNALKIFFFVVLLYFQVGSLFSAIYSFILSETITLSLRIISIRKVIGACSDTAITYLSRDEKIAFTKYSVTVALITGIGLIIQSIDKIMIANYLSFSDVGIYKVAQNYVALIGVFISPFIAFWPIISKLYKDLVSQKFSAFKPHP